MSHPSDWDYIPCSCGGRGKCADCCTITKICFACKAKHDEGVNMFYQGGYSKTTMYTCAKCLREVCDRFKCVKCDRAFCKECKQGVNCDSIMTGFHCTDCFTFIPVSTDPDSWG